MKEDYTDITILLDRSGSMDSIKKDMEGGFQQFIKEQRKIPGDLRITLYEFNTELLNRYTEVSVYNVSRLDIIPRGTTALLDSAYTVIQQTGERLKNKSESERPQHVIFTIITDGMENSSKEVSRESLCKLIKQQENEYQWNFIYLGANQDAFAEGGSLGIMRGATITYHPTSASISNLYSTYSSAITRVRSTADSVDSESFFSSEEQEEVDKA